jgi:muconate cycloisomerase
MPDIEDLGRVLATLLKGHDPRDISAINELMLKNYPEANDYYDKGSFIRCGIDIALYDLVAKSLEEPISTLLGGRCRDRFKVCYPIFRHRHLEEIEANLRVVGERLALGFDVIRLYVGANLDADEVFLRQLKESYGDQVKVKSLDFSHLLTWKEARQALRRLEKYEFTLVESGSFRNDCEGMARLRQSIDHPLSEHVWSMHELHQLIRHDSIDILNIAPIFIGGLTAARKAFAVAEASGKRCLLGTTQESSIGTAAQAQLGAAMANLTDVSDPTGPVLYANDVVEEPVQYEDGYLIVPPVTRAGLGISLSETRIKELRAPLSWGGMSSASVLDRTVPVSEITNSEGAKEVR